MGHFSSRLLRWEDLLGRGDGGVQGWNPGVDPPLSESGAGARVRVSTGGWGHLSGKMLSLGQRRRGRDWWYREGQAERPGGAQRGKEAPRSWGSEGGQVGEQQG